MSTTFKLQDVKRFKRGASWVNGEARMCTRCNADEDRRRSNRAVVTANIRKLGSKIKVPVGYCEIHIPEEIK